MKAKHTKLPYRTVFGCKIASNNQKVVAECIPDSPISVLVRPREQESIANAEFIVRACNAHYELLNALNLLLLITVDERINDGFELTDGEEQARETALKAIAKATGEET